MKNIFKNLFGFNSDKEKTQVSVEKETDTGEVNPYSDMIVKLEREDPPEFSKTYSGTICDVIGIEIKIKTRDYGYSWSDPNERDISGTLKQAGRGDVYFDPKSIAEKIILPNVVKEAEAFIKHAKKLDAEFCATQRGGFVDKRGNKWIMEKRE